MGGRGRCSRAMRSLPGAICSRSTYQTISRAPTKRCQRILPQTVDGVRGHRCDLTGPNTASMHAVDAGMLGAAGLTYVALRRLIAQREEDYGEGRQELWFAVLAAWSHAGWIWRGNGIAASQSSRLHSFRESDAGTRPRTGR